LKLVLVRTKYNSKRPLLLMLRPEQHVFLVTDTAALSIIVKYGFTRLSMMAESTAA
jgi:hypothetical protein